MLRSRAFAMGVAVSVALAALLPVGAPAQQATAVAAVDQKPITVRDMLLLPTYGYRLTAAASSSRVPNAMRRSGEPHRTSGFMTLRRTAASS
jgi:hypothetical protein